MRERLDEFARHIKVRRFVDVIAHDVDNPSARARRQQQRAGKLRAVLQAHRAGDFARAGSVKNRRQQIATVALRINAILHPAQ